MYLKLGYIFLLHYIDEIRPIHSSIRYTTHPSSINLFPFPAPIWMKQRDCNVCALSFAPNRTTTKIFVWSEMGHKHCWDKTFHNYAHFWRRHDDDGDATTRTSHSSVYCFGCVSVQSFTSVSGKQKKSQKKCKSDWQMPSVGIERIDLLVIFLRACHTYILTVHNPQSHSNQTVIVIERKTTHINFNYRWLMDSFRRHYFCASSCSKCASPLVSQVSFDVEVSANF